jgi:hypothetical protein
LGSAIPGGTKFCLEAPVLLTSISLSKKVAKDFAGVWKSDENRFIFGSIQPVHEDQRHIILFLLLF